MPSGLGVQVSPAAIIKKAHKMIPHIEIEIKEKIYYFGEDELDAYNKYYKTYDGRAVFVNGRKKKEIAKFWLYLINGDLAQAEDQKIEELIDTYMEEFNEYTKPIYKDGHIKDEYVNFGLSNNTLILHWLEIYPEFRGKGFGELIVAKIVSTFYSQIGAIVLYPFPLQYTMEVDGKKKWMSKMKLPKKLSEDEALKKVKKFWKSLGFRKIPKSDVCYYKG